MQHRPAAIAAITLALTGALLLFGAPTMARADTPSAVATVQAAQSAIGATFTGDPANAPAPLTPINNGVSGTDAVGTTIGVSLPPADNPTAVANAPMATDTMNSSLAPTAPSTPVALPTQGGYSMSQVIAGPSSPMSYTYKFNFPTGYHLVPAPGPVNYANSGVMLDTTGLYAITNAAPLAVASGKVTLDGTNTIGWIHPPTAVDANGIQSLHTSYTQLSGTKLMQTVTPSVYTAWPVVADPSISFGWVIYVHYNHYEVGNVLIHAFFAAVAGAVTVACGVASLGWLAYPCAALFAFAGVYMVELFNQAYSRGGGIVFKFFYTGTYVGYDFVGNNYS